MGGCALDGILPAVLAAARAGHDTVMVPAGNATEAALVPGVRVVGVASLLEAAIWHGGEYDERAVDMVPSSTTAIAADTEVEVPGDLADVSGNDDAVEGMLVAAAGGHHIYLLGPPGAGKTMLASRLPGILPDLDADAALEVASHRSLAGMRPASGLSFRPPFEAPHHTATAAAMVGGGSRLIRPGAAARAPTACCSSTRRPSSVSRARRAAPTARVGTIAIHRANAVASFPAKFQLVLAANPCPCGNGGTAECTCPPIARRRYLGRISGPLLDRVDVQLRVPRITLAVLRAAGERPGLSSADARAKVIEARAVAAERLRGTPWRTNAEMPGPWMRGAGPLHPGGHAAAALDRSLERGGITMRGYDRVLKVAWTLADLDGSAAPRAQHVTRALFFKKGIER